MCQRTIVVAWPARDRRNSTTAPRRSLEPSKRRSRSVCLVGAAVRNLDVLKAQPRPVHRKVSTA